MRTHRAGVIAFVCSLAAAGSSILWCQDSPNSHLPDWLPTERPAGRVYFGNDQCIACHASQAVAANTPMGNALQPGGESGILASHKDLSFESGVYRYRIVRDGRRSIYSVTDGKETITAPILWSFGHGKAGQTYVFEHEGSYYESRISFYLAVNSLDWTLGAPPGDIPGSLEEAAGRRMSADDVRGCFGCHATGAVHAGRAALEELIPGITCEGCHGPGDQHVRAVQSGRLQDRAITGLTRLEAEEESDFCGSCHRTWSDVVLMGLQGVNNVRFQPYRLANSPCYDAADTRIRCSACHNPHEELRRDAAFYATKCHACHRGPPGSAPAAGASEAACPVSTANCAGCHMPKYEMPGSHFSFTDHQIRIARPGDPYPN